MNRILSLFNKKPESVGVMYESDPKKVLDYLPRLYLNYYMFRNLARHTRGYELLRNADLEALEGFSILQQYSNVIKNDDLVHIGYVFFEEPLDLKGDFAIGSKRWLKRLDNLHTETPFKRTLRELRYKLFRT